MRAYFLRTERIGFSHWQEEDLPLADALWGDNDVTHYICAGGRFSEDDIRSRLQLELSNQRCFGVQYWPMFEAVTDTMIGCCGLRPYKSEADTYEIGFHLRPAYWGQSYAVEAASAVLQYAFGTIKALKVVAGHHPENVNSKKQLLRLGFRYIGDHFYEPTGLLHPFYEIGKDEFDGAVQVD